MRILKRARSALVRYKPEISCVKDIASAAFEFSKKPGAVSAIRSGTSIIYSLASYYGTQSTGYSFNPPEWSEVFSQYLSRDLIRAMGDAPRMYIARDEGRDGYDALVRAHGCAFGISRYNDGREALFVRSDAVERAKSALGATVRRGLPQAAIVRVKRDHWCLSSLWVEPETNQDILTSDRASEIVTMLQRFVRAREPRTVMLYGKPGVGKTTMARSIAHMLGGRSLRIQGRDISSVCEAGVLAVADLYRPTVIIIDDFDRWASPQSHLDFLTDLRRAAPIVILTVNDTENIDKALMRPERVDQVIDVAELGDEAMRSLLGSRHDLFERVRHWPAASIRELAVRAKVLGSHVVEASIVELEERMRPPKNDEGKPAAETGKSE